MPLSTPASLRTTPAHHPFKSEKNERCGCAACCKQPAPLGCRAGHKNHWPIPRRCHKESHSACTSSITPAGMAVIDSMPTVVNQDSLYQVLSHRREQFFLKAFMAGKRIPKERSARHACFMGGSCAGRCRDARVATACSGVDCAAASARTPLSQLHPCQHQPAGDTTLNGHQQTEVVAV